MSSGSRSRGKWCRRIAAVVVLAVQTLPLAGVVFADDTADEADLQFNLGVERYRAGDFQGALEHFLASNRLARNRVVIFNIARSYDKLHSYPEAFRYYVRALEGETDPGTKQQIEDAMRAMAPNVAILNVTTDPPGAQIYLDRKDLGARGNAPQRLGLPAGTYRVIAEVPGYEDATSDAISIQNGAELPVRLTLRRILGTVHVEGDAVGATVRADSENAPPLGTVPGDFQLAPGRHTLLVTRPGYQTTTLLVDVAPQQTIVVRPSITAKTGTLVVNADERDAIINVDGEPRGFTPAVVTVPVGPHKIRVELKGFRTVTREVTIDTNQQARIDVELVAAEQVEAASRATESVEEAPASVSIVSSKELRAMQYPNVAEALRGTRGVYVTDDRGYVSLGFRGFGYPGSYGNRVLVLLDGQPMNDDWLFQSYTGYDLRSDLADVERIEVVRGPGSVLYGTSAFSGVINLVTRGNDVPESREIGVTTADANLARGRARVTHYFSKDSGVWTSVSGGHSAGRDFFFPEYVNDGPAGVAGNARGVDGIDVGTWTGRWWWKDLTAQWSFNSHRKTIPTGQFITIIGDGRTQQTDTRAMGEVKYEPKIGDSLQSLSRLHLNYYQYRGTFVHLPDGGGIEHTNFDGLWAGLEQRFVYAPSQRVRLTAGGEIQRHFLVHQYDDNEQTNTTLDDYHPFNQGAVYALADLTPVDPLKLSAGVRVDTYQTFGSSVNPRLAAVTKPYRDGIVKVMFGKAFRAPSVYESFYSGVGQLTNPSLNPENIYSGEVEYSHRFSSSLTATVAGYANYIQGLIQLKTATNSSAANPVACPTDCIQYQNTNAPVATLGGEFELRREWKEGWMLSATYSFAHSQYLASESFGDFLSLAKNGSLREVPNAPQHMASFRGGVPIIGRQLMAFTRVTFESPRFDRNDSNAAGTPPQAETTDAVIWDFVFSGFEQKWGLSYALGLYNAFDWRYFNPLSPEYRQDTILQTGRTVLASLGLTF